MFNSLSSLMLRANETSYFEWREYAVYVPLVFYFLGHFALLDKLTKLWLQFGSQAIFYSAKHFREVLITTSVLKLQDSRHHFRMTVFTIIIIFPSSWTEKKIMIWTYNVLGLWQKEHNSGVNSCHIGEHWNGYYGNTFTM